ncbi:MAG: GTPase [Planctomycetota bacterium]
MTEGRTEQEEAIYALASPPPPATQVMIRLDGFESVRHAEALFSCNTTLLQPRSPMIVDLVWDQSSLPTPALAVSWKKGASWTGNEGVELFLPGSVALLDGIFAQLEEAGLRPAQPGEFTRRAFMNGRIDLSRAESVAALIEAEDRASLAAARRVHDGELADAIRSAGDSLLDVIALIEAGLDFSEQEIESPGAAGARKLLGPILIDLENLLERRQWAVSPEGVPRVLLWGRANAGKSSLFNALLGQDLAIASAEAGTTTDAVRGILEFGGRQIELLDLPGERTTSGEIESLALERAGQLLQGDDPILWVIDASRDPLEIEQEEAEISSEFEVRLRPVFTQVDRISPQSLKLYPSAMRVSSVTGEGVEALRQELFKWTSVSPGKQRADAIRFSRRQWQLVADCKNQMEQAIAAADGGPELLVEDLRQALSCLEEVTGESTPEDVLDRIFSRFCLGK